jgi:NhaP-type Na+/H+ or K+/H+ antiporter
MANESNNSVPSWVMLLIFVLIEATLWFFGDLFTFLVGTFVTILVFANGYDNKHQEEDSH